MEAKTYALWHSAHLGGRHPVAWRGGPPRRRGRRTQCELVVPFHQQELSPVLVGEESHGRRPVPGRHDWPGELDAPCRQLAVCGTDVLGRKDDLTVPTRLLPEVVARLRERRLQRLEDQLDPALAGTVRGVLGQFEAQSIAPELDRSSFACFTGVAIRVVSISPPFVAHAPNVRASVVDVKYRSRPDLSGGWYESRASSLPLLPGRRTGAELHPCRERLHMAQPAPSARVREIERRLGVELFDRTTRRVELAAAGRALLPHARHAVTAADRGAREARRASRGEVGELAVGIILGPRPRGRLTCWPPSVSVIPTVTMRLEEHDFSDPSAGLRSGRTDVAFIVLPIDSDGLSFRAFEERAVLAIVPSDHAVANRESISNQEILSEPWIVATEDAVCRDY